MDSIFFTKKRECHKRIHDDLLVMSHRHYILLLIGQDILIAHLFKYFLAFTWSTEFAPQANGVMIITLKSTFAIEHSVVGGYFPLELYTIIFTPGKANADNSLLYVSHTERMVGEDVKIYITPYDQFNNYIEPTIRYKDESPYQVKYSNDVEKNKVIKSKYNIELKGEINVLSYPASFFIRE